MTNKNSRFLQSKGCLFFFFCILKAIFSVLGTSVLNLQKVSKKVFFTGLEPAADQSNGTRIYGHIQPKKATKTDNLQELVKRQFTVSSYKGSLQKVTDNSKSLNGIYRNYSEKNK